MAENYDLIFGKSASSQYAWSDSDYQNGWQTVGSTPPTAEQFDALQRRSDTKAKDLNNRLSPLETTASKALARVTPAANRLPYFNSSNSATTTAISDFIKTLLDDKDAKTARATLGAPSTTGANASGSWDINAATATKLATPRKINITGNASGSADFDGSGNVSISTTVNESTHAAVADVVSEAIHPRGVYGNTGYIFYGTLTIPQDGDFFKLEVLGGNGFNADIGQSREGTLYFRTGNSNPAHYAAYSEYHRNGAGGLKFFVVKDSGTQYRIYGGLANYTGLMQVIPYVGQRSSFDLALTRVSALPDGADEVEQQQLIYASKVNNYAPTKTGDGASGTWGIDISGNAASATKATSATTAAAANALNSMGNKTAIEDGTREPLNLSLYQVYNDGYPVSYGNLLSIGGVGGGELLAEWRGVDKGIGHLYYRNRRDAGNVWSDWSTVAFTSDINNYAPTKTGGGASGTWGINISGNAASATKATSATTAAACSGNSATATKLATPRTISLTGNASGSANFDGSGDVSINTTVNESKHAVKADNATNASSAASATNADKLDGAHLADIYRHVGGHDTSTITSIIDWNTMKACNGGTDVRNINNTTYGIRAYSGNSDFSSGVLNGYAHGSFYLTQDFTNFDKLCFLFCSDAGKDIEYTMTDVFLLNYIMTNYSVVNLSHDNDDFWIVTGYSNKGTAKDKVSTKRIFSAPASLEAQNCGIVDVLGIKY